MPLLVGVPRLLGTTLYVPTTAGLEVWSVEPGAEGTADRVLPWPEGSQGGTPTPLPGGGWVVVRRGDEELGTESALEILGGG